jgi:cytochrome c oxidase subunit I
MSPSQDHQVLTFPTKNNSSLFKGTLARFWMMLGVSALAVPGLFAIVLVIARGGSLSHMPVFANMFTKALVVHVDLLVLVWFLSMAFMLWSLLVSRAKPWLPYLEESAIGCFAAGMIAITLSAFDPSGEALKSNYIPVIMSPVFFIGLSLLLCGMLFMLCRLLTTGNYHPAFSKPLQYGVLVSGLIGVMALIAFVWSHMLMPPEIDGTQYYDMAFWGGGHILQFIHVQAVMICWLLLARALKPDYAPSDTILYGLFSVGLVAALMAPFIYVMYDVYSSQHRLFFTHQMMGMGGLAPAILAIMLAPLIWQHRDMRKGGQRALWSALVMSVLLFLFGGIIGGMIREENVVVPAHYHGSIVGITLAFMGLTYWLLPLFGYKNMSGSKLAYWQPIICGVGQIMHVAGLAWSGGYGVLRKTPGGLAGAPTEVKIAMGIMEWGGLLAVIGGVMFIVVVVKSVRNTPDKKKPA